MADTQFKKLLDHLQQQLEEKDKKLQAQRDSEQDLTLKYQDLVSRFKMQQYETNQKSQELEQAQKMIDDLTKGISQKKQEQSEQRAKYESMLREAYGQLDEKINYINELEQQADRYVTQLTAKAVRIEELQGELGNNVQQLKESQDALQMSKTNS